MNLFGVMEVSASALQAERVRAEVVASNMANAETTQTAEGGPYRRHHVVFAAQDSGSFQQSMLGQLGASNSLAGSSNVASQFSSKLATFGAAVTAGGSVPGGVAVAGVIQDESQPLRRYDPQHPDAGSDGYVAYPDINPLTEMVDLMGATRAYGMNASAVQAEKGMLAASLDLLK